MEIKDKIKIGRLRKNLTQRQLSDLTGIPISSIQKYETGERIPKREALKKIEKVLGYSNEIVKKIVFYSSRISDENKQRVADYAEILYRSEHNKKDTDR